MHYLPALGGPPAVCIKAWRHDSPSAEQASQHYKVDECDGLGVGDGGLGICLTFRNILLAEGSFVLALFRGLRL